MMSYAEYRAYFIKIKPLIKFNYLLKKCKISHANFSHFINDGYQTVSLMKLEEFYKVLQDEISDKIA